MRTFDSPLRNPKIFATNSLIRKVQKSFPFDIWILLVPGYRNSKKNIQKYQNIAIKYCKRISRLILQIKRKQAARIDQVSFITFHNLMINIFLLFKTQATLYIHEHIMVPIQVRKGVQSTVES